MLFNDVDLTEIITISNIRGRGAIQTEVDLINVTGMHGAYYRGKRVPPRIIEVDFWFKSESMEEVRKEYERLNDILNVEEPVAIVFEDEEDRTYYGVPEGVPIDFDTVNITISTLIFVCPDPFKYGEEKQANLFVQDGTIINYEGSVETEPIFEFDVRQSSTFVMVANDKNEYMMIGRPADDDIQEIDTRTSVLYENGSTIDQWIPASPDMVDTNFMTSIDGVMGTDGAGIRVTDYGTPSDRLRGAAVFKELPSAIENFEVETTFDIISRREIENWRMGIMLHDENMNNLGHIGLKDNSRLYKRRVPLARIGQYRGGGLSNGNLIGDSQGFDNARETTLFYLRVVREGQKYTFYIGEWQGHRHIRSWQESYIDYNDQFDGKLKFITLYIGSYQDRVTPSRIRINSVEVFELGSVVEDQTPYIVRPGDKVIYDHKEKELFLNGEDVKVFKDFGGSYFKMHKGENTFTMLPTPVVEGVVKWRDKFL